MLIRVPDELSASAFGLRDRTLALLLLTLARRSPGPGRRRSTSGRSLTARPCSRPPTREIRAESKPSLNGMPLAAARTTTIVLPSEYRSTPCFRTFDTRSGQHFEI